LVELGNIIKTLVTIFLMLFGLVVSSLLITAASAQNQTVATKNVKGESKAKEIFIGILLGMEEDVGNLTTCLKDSDEGFDDIAKFYQLIKQGIDHFSPRDIFAAFPFLSNGLSYLEQAVRACGVIKVADDLAKIVAELATPGGWLIVLKQEGLKLIVHGKDVTEDILNAIADYELHKWEGFGKNIGKILGLLL